MSDNQNLFFFTLATVYPHILKHLKDEESINLVRTCRNVKNIMYNYGFFKQITYNGYDMIRFAIASSRHEYTLNQIIFNRVSDPGNLLPNTKASIILNLCDITNLNPHRTLNNIKILTITYSRRLFPQSYSIINWKKFPNLEKLHIKGIPVSLKNISYCKNLNTLTFYSNSYNNFRIPQEAFNLPNLKHLAVTCHADGLISDKLETFIGDSNIDIVKDIHPNLKFFDNGYYSWIRNQKSIEMNEEVENVKLEMRGKRIMR